MTFQFSTQQISDITTHLANGADVDGTYQTLYSYIFDAISDGGDPATGVDASVWLWVRGARDVNAGSGYFAEYIRDYTAQQYLLRTGDDLSEGVLQARSNDIAREFAADIIADTNRYLPTIGDVGLLDASPIAADIFSGNFSPWAGTILFPFLGVSDFTTDWILNLSTSAEKLLSGTYDLVAAAQTAHEITSPLAAWMHSGDLEYTIQNNSLGEEDTLTLLENLRDAASTFFQDAYDLPDVEKYRIGGDLPLYGTASFDSGLDYVIHPTFLVGTTGNDSSFVGSSGDDIINTGTGNDIIIASGGSDLIDGDGGTDTVTYAASDGVWVTETALAGTLYDYRFDVSKGPGASDAVYGIEALTLSAYADVVFLRALHGITLNGGDGYDIVDYSRVLDTAVTVTISGYGATVAGEFETDTLTSVENIRGTTGDDTFILTGDAFSSADFIGGAGSDTYDFTATGFGFVYEKFSDTGVDNVIIDPSVWTTGGTWGTIYSGILYLTTTTGPVQERWFTYAPLGIEQLNGHVWTDYVDGGPPPGDPALPSPGNGGGGGSPSSGFGSPHLPTMAPPSGLAPPPPYRPIDDGHTPSPAGPGSLPGEWPLPTLGPEMSGIVPAVQAAMDNGAAERYDPLVLDLSGAGFNLTGVSGSHAYFDLIGAGTSFANVTGWTAAGSGLGFLVQDAGSDGFIHDISEMFGNALETGFEELSGLDSNTDDKISSADTDWGTLKVWIDENADGVSQSGELHTLGSLGITEIGLTTSASGADINGNTLVETATFLRNSVNHTIGEVLFEVDPTNSVYNEDVAALDWDALALPWLRGYGVMADSYVAETLDGTLLTMAGNLQAEATLADFNDYMTDVRAFMYQWADVTGVDPDDRGADLWGPADAQELAFLEHYTGLEFETPGGMPNPVWYASWQLINQTFNYAQAELAAKFIAQSDGDLKQVTYYDMGADMLRVTGDAGDLDAAAPTSTANETALYWAVLSQAVTDDWATKLHILEQMEATGDDLTTDQKNFFNIAVGTSGNNASLQAPDLFRPEIIIAGDGDDTGGVFYNQAHSLFYGGAGEDSFTGGSGNDILVGGAGDDNLTGSFGRNTFVINADDGQDTINGSIGDDTVVFTGGLGSGDLSYARHLDDLVITIGAGGDSLTVQNHFASSSYGTVHDYFMERITFTGAPQDALDATSINTLAAANATGTSGADFMYGLDGVSDVIGSGDGADTLYGNGGSDVLSGGNGIDFLYGGDVGTTNHAGDTDTLDGGAGADILASGVETDTVFIGGVGNDTMQAGSGDDIFIVADGDGNDSIQSNTGGGFADSGRDHIVFDAGVSVASVHYTKSSNNLVVTYGTGSDSITISNYFQSGYENYTQVTNVRFSDVGNTVHDFVHIFGEALTQNGTSGTDVMYGIGGTGFYTPYVNSLNGLGGADYLQTYAGNDVLNGGTGSDDLYGGAGNDTYLFSSGDGADLISEGNSGGTDTILFDNTVSVGSVTVAHSGTYNVLVTYGSDSIVLYNFYSSTGYRIENISFSDVGNTTWDYDDINSMVHTLRGTSGANSISAFDSMSTTFIGGLGDDTLYGSSANDTYMFDEGDGDDTISENYGSGDTIVITDSGVDPGDATYTKSGYNLVIGYGTSGDTVTVSSFFYPGYAVYYQVESVQFSDGGTTVHNLAHILAEAHILRGTSGANSLSAFDSDPTTFIGGQGDDALNGGTGSDTYKFAEGDGDDTIYEGGGGTDMILITDSGVDPDDTTYTKSGYSLVIGYGTSGDTITVGYFFYPGYESYYGVESVHFTDGGNTVHSYSHIIEQAHILRGTSGANSLSAFDNGDTTIFGEGGADYLYGSGGNDTLYGGDGADYLSGSTGADTFVFEAATAFNNIDTVADFNTGQGDVLDISDLLSGYTPGVDTLADFVSITDSGGNGHLRVDRDGTAGTYGMTEVATIYGVTGLDVSTLLSNDNLIVPV